MSTVTPQQPLEGSIILPGNSGPSPHSGVLSTSQSSKVLDYRSLLPRTSWDATVPSVSPFSSLLAVGDKSEAKTEPIKAALDSFGIELPENREDQARSKLKEMFVALCDTVQEKTLPEYLTALKESDSPSDKKIIAIAKAGFVGLAEKLLKKKGARWDAIRAIPSPCLQEQLATLLEISEKIGDQQLAKTVMDFSILLSKQVAVLPSDHPNGAAAINLEISEAMSVASQMLGLITFLLEKKDSSLGKILKGGDLQKSFLDLEAAMKPYLSKVEAEIEEIKTLHRNSTFQDPKRVTAAQLPLRIASLLMTEEGSINFGLVPFIRDEFVRKLGPDGSYMKDIIHVMEGLIDSPALRDAFENVQAPQLPNEQANDVIRITLKKDKDSSISCREARLTALSALMSHLRQGKVGSCFATFLALDLKSGRLERCLEDFAELIKTSQLVRNLEGEEVIFPFLLHMAEENSNRKVLLNPEGRIIAKEGLSIEVWKAPGIVEAARALGMKDYEKVLQEGIAKLSGKEVTNHPSLGDLKDIREISARGLISILAMEAKNRDPRHGAQYYLARGVFAFEAQTNHPLTRVWENAIAGMAEPNMSGIFHSEVISSISFALGEKVKILLSGKDVIAEGLVTAVLTELGKRVRLRFDNDVRAGTLSADGHSSAGGYVLYDKDGKDGDPANWKRIDSPDRFKAFSHNVVEIVLRQLDQFLVPPEQREEVKKIARDLLSFIKSNSYVTMCLNRFHWPYAAMVNPLEKWQELENTPWVNLTGNDSNQVVRVYLERTTNPKLTKAVPKSAQDLLKIIVNLAKEHPEEFKEEFLSNPTKLLPIRTTGIHAFGLLLAHPSFAEVWSTNVNLQSWVEDRILRPGIEVAKSLVPPDTQEVLFNFMKKHFIPEEKVEDYTAAIEGMDEELTVVEFRNELLGKLKKLLPDTPEDKWKKIFINLDTMLVRKLPEAAKEHLRKSAVHFADTNWESGMQDLHFAFMVNPGTGEIEVWRISEDQQNFLAMDQNQWVVNQAWEFYPPSKEYEAA